MSNMVVRTNVFALNAHRNMKNVGADQARSSQRLSSGYRINSAADDAAGLAISESMRSQIRGLDQASRNSQDGQALINTAEGGMQEIQNMIQRIRELTVQAANDTNSNNNRSYHIALEIDQLLIEIDQMATRVEFNGMTLLNGDFTGPGNELWFQIGANQLQGMTMNIGNMTIRDETITRPNGPATLNATIMLCVQELLSGVSAADLQSLEDLAQIARDINEWFTAEGAHSALNTQMVNGQNLTGQWRASINFDEYGNNHSLTMTWTDDYGNETRFTFNFDEEWDRFDPDPVRTTYSPNFNPVQDSLGEAMQHFIQNWQDVFRAIGGSARPDWGVDSITNNTSLVSIHTCVLDLLESVSLDDLTSAQDLINILESINDWFTAEGQFSGLNTIDGVTGQWRAVGNFDDRGEPPQHSITIRWTDPDGNRTEFTFNFDHDLDRFALDYEREFIPYDEGRIKGREISELISSLEAGLEFVSRARAEMGAASNRLDFTMRSLDISSENLSDAESRVRNTDMAREMMRFTMANVLQQAAVSMLAQANQLPNNLLQLLR